MLIIPNFNTIGSNAARGGGSTHPFEYTAIDNTYSMEFDGVASRMQLTDGATHFTPDVPLATTGETEGSISLWFKLNNASIGGNKTFMSLTCGGGASNGYIFMKFNQGGQSGRYVRIYTTGANATQTGIQTTQSFIYDNSNTTWSGSGITWEQDVWYHLAYVYDASSTNRVKIYINGNEFLLPNTTNASSTDGIRTLGDVPYSLPYSYKVGAATYPQINLGCVRNASSYAEFWSGYIDEAATFTKALSADTIQAIYDTTTNNPGKVADLSETPEGAPETWYRMGD